MTLQAEIVCALIEGFEGVRVTTNLDGNDILVSVEGNDEPIRVLENDVDLPEWAKPLAPGIRLDVQAILADREEERA